MRASPKPSRKEYGLARRDADLIDDRQVKGNWVDYSHRCAHPILQEPRLRDQFHHMTKVGLQINQTKMCSLPTEVKSIMPSLTTALVSALGATTELFATPFDFNPKMKHYSAPFAEDAGLMLTQMQFLSSGRAAATATQYHRMPRC